MYVYTYVYIVCIRYIYLASLTSLYLKTTRGANDQMEPLGDGSLHMLIM